MSIDDFRRLTPGEFDAIYGEWRTGQDSIIHGEWERCRWICYFILKTYAKKTLKPTDIFSFDWDNHGRKMTKEEREAEKKEFERLKELWKDEESGI